MGHETAFIRAFVVPSKRERLDRFLRGPRRRGEALATLDHSRDLDERFRVEIAPSNQHADAIARLLTERGAPSVCHLISGDRALDGRDLSRAEAIRRIVGSGEGTFVSCIPGRLGYFEGESPGDRCILERDLP